MQNSYAQAVSPAGCCAVGPCFRITVLTARMLRLEYSEDGRFEDRPSLFAIRRAFPEVPAFEVCRRNGRLELHTEYLSLFYNEKPFSAGGLSIKVRSETRGIYSTWHFGDKLCENLGGTARTLDMADGSIPLGKGIQSRLQGYSVIDDSATPLLDPDGSVQPRPTGVTDLYFFGYGLEYQAALNDFFILSGRPPLLPRFALGNWWSRFHAYTAEEYLALMDRFRDERIPFSVAILDMDWHPTELTPKQGKGWTGYTWNKRLFPDPAAFLGQLHARGLTCSLNLHPAEGIQPNEEQYAAAAAHMGLDPEEKRDIPFDMCSKKFVDVYFEDLLKPREEEGVDFWWIDWQQGDASGIDGADPLWLLNHFHYLRSAEGGKRPLILSRYAGPGSHRYPVGFSGDTVISWASLRFQPYFTATAANIGYGWWSHDIGGHCGGVYDEELMARWVQFGVFSPILRLHSTSNLFNGKEPWNYSPEICGILKGFLRLRHQLIPYLYTMNCRSAEEGIMPLRPMYYLHPRQEEAYQVPNQYYFGEQLLVCPITEPASRETGLGSVAAWIPEGVYYDVFTGQRYASPGMRILHRPIARIPVLAKAGTILPLTAPEEAAQFGTALPESLEVHVFCGADGEYTLYEDAPDGSARRARTRFAITWQENGRMRLRIEPDADDGSVRPELREYRVLFHGIEDTAVSAPGELVFDRAYDPDRRILKVTLRPMKSGKTIELWAQAPVLAGPDTDRRAFDLLRGCRIGFEQKDQIYRRVCEKADKKTVLPELQAMGLSMDLLNALTELLYE